MSTRNALRTSVKVTGVVVRISPSRLTRLPVGRVSTKAVGDLQEDVARPVQGDLEPEQGDGPQELPAAPHAQGIDVEHAVFERALGRHEDAAPVESAVADDDLVDHALGLPGRGS